MPFVSEIIGNSFNDWCSGQIVVISAPTGSGKTTFIMEQLLPHVSADYTIVYLTNRTALKEQIQSILTENYPDHSNKICVMNYQRLFSILKQWGTARLTQKYGTEANALNNCSYLVLDEAHYLFADVNFNYRIGEFYKYLQFLFYRIAPMSIKILISASEEYLDLGTCMLMHSYNALSQIVRDLYTSLPYYLKDGSYITKILHMKYLHPMNMFDMKHAETEDYPLLLGSVNDGKMPKQYSLLIHNPDQPHPRKTKSFQNEFQQFREMIQNLFHLQPMPLDYYICGKADYSYVTPVYFNNYDEIAAIVDHTPISEKWLIFIASVDEAHDFLQKMNQRPFDTVVITSSNKKRPKSLSKEQFQIITQKEQFTSRVLVATSVLDNGINLKDESIRHVVIPACFKYEFIQMLGRKRRINDTDCITLYIQNKPESRMLNKVNQDIVWKLQNLEKKYNDPQFSRNLIQDMRLHYDFLDLMSVFERAQDNRFNVMQAMLNACEDHNEEELQRVMKKYEYLFPIMADYGKLMDNASLNTKWLEKTDKALMDNDFLWLREQLSWIGLTYETAEDPLNPHNPDHWITALLKRILIDFLESHMGILEEEQQEQLKKHFIIYIQSIRPHHKNNHSKGSIGIINRCFREKGIPYKITQKRVQQIQRWVVSYLPEN